MRKLPLAQGLVRLRALAGRVRLRWAVPLIGLALVALLLLPGRAALRRQPEPPPAVPVQALPASAKAPFAMPRETDAEMDPPPPESDPLPAAPDPDAWRDAADDANDADSHDCIIEPSETVEIGSPIEGLIDSILVERSDVVEKGQPLVRLESDVERAQVKLARARSHMQGAVKAREAAVALQQRREGRVGQLYDNNALSLDLRDQAEAEASIARGELEEAEDNRRLASLQLDQAVAVLRRREIRSPVSGVVVDRLMSPGEVVDHETILVVAQIDPLRVEVILPAALFGSVRPGMRAAVEPELPGDRVYVASVKVVDRVIDAASGTFGVWLDLPNADHEIPGGLNCRVRFLDE
jgi:RND family efflux transporter MFP subunit